MAISDLASDQEDSLRRDERLFQGYVVLVCCRQVVFALFVYECSNFFDCHANSRSRYSMIRATTS